jgi:hypothetical protein
MRPMRSRQNAGAILLGGILIVIGIAWLAGQFVRIDVGHYGWPFFVIAPGLLLLVLELTTPQSAPGLAVAGCVVTVTGLILLYQNSTDHFASWAYAWALVAPGSVGLGLLLHGWVGHNPALVKSGSRTAAVGLGLFIAGAFFFEAIIGLGGERIQQPARIALALVVIAVGVGLLVFNLRAQKRR